jgi:hypothetical protein
MEKSEQSVGIKFLWAKEVGARRIHRKLSWVLDDDCYTPAAIERWLAHFREGDLSYAGHSRLGWPVIDISECLRAFLDKFPFAIANVMSKYFRIVREAIMEILQLDLGLQKFSRRWVPRQLSSSQKAGRVNRSRALSHLLQQLQPFDFE